MSKSSNRTVFEIILEKCKNITTHNNLHKRVQKKKIVTELLFVFTNLFITALAMLIWDRFAERNRGEFMGEGVKLTDSNFYKHN